MKRIFIASFLMMSTFFQLLASDPNISGQWNGKRLQYNAEKNAYIADFEYRYHLVQEGNQVRGTAKIILGEYYADINLRGFVEGNKFYFEEYEVTKAQRREGYLWCLKKGVLDIKVLETGNMSLSGATPSFLENYGFECTGGVTFLDKAKVNPSIQDVHEVIASNSKTNYHIEIAPNPFFESANIKLNLDKKEVVQVDIIDIQGRIVKDIHRGELEAGDYSFEFRPGSDIQATYFYVRMKIGAKTFSKPIQRVNY
jgi:hypothetical protein